jgi:hypothetical protein
MQITSITVMALLLAHLLGDFPLQSQWISKNKGSNLGALTLHGAIHYLLAWVCLLAFTPVSGLLPANQLFVLGYIAIHVLVDTFKYRLTSRQILPDDSKTFLLDQLMHAVVLVYAAILLTGNHIGQFIARLAQFIPIKVQILEVAIVYVAVIFGGGYLIRNLTKGLAKHTLPSSPDQLPNAGLYIGWLERLLVLTAIAVQTPTLVGLILTGKSIARFPELKDARFVEYFLIGTLLSLSLSLLGGIVLHQLLYGAISLK